MRITAVVPATVANLGPGFDCFGLALDLCNEVTIDTDAQPAVTWEGEGADELPTDGSDVVARAMHSLADLHGKRLPSCSLRGVNRIPLERGLGSSAAAAVAGIAIATRVLGAEASPEAMLGLASAVEGHPDNVAAAILGGFTIAYGDGKAVRLDPSADLRPVVMIPSDRMSTAEARRALTESVERSQAVFNIQRAALAVEALTRRPTLLRDALQDRLHQNDRLALTSEDVRALFRELVDLGIPVCVAGAGPSLLAFETNDLPVPDPGPGWRVLRIAVRPSGVQLT